VLLAAACLDARAQSERASGDPVLPPVPAQAAGKPRPGADRPGAPGASGAPAADSLAADSLALRHARTQIPNPPQWRLDVIDSLSAASLRGATAAEPRDVLRSGLALGLLDPGSPHVPYPIHETVPGRDAPELRVDGLPIAPVRWGETSPASFPVLALSDVRLRRATPIDGPLSSTGGSVIEARLAGVPRSKSVSAVRLTRGNNGTFTEEAILRRPVGSADFVLFYGDSKTSGRQSWRRQNGETFGLRLTQAAAGGAAQWIYDNARDRFRLLSTKKGRWDRRSVGLRWVRSDSTRAAVETSARWTSMDAGWWTTLGLTQRETKAVDFRGRVETPGPRDRLAMTVEGEIASTRFVRPGEERELLDGVDGISLGIAGGWTRAVDAKVTTASIGLVRLAPLGVTGTFAFEHERPVGGSKTLSLHASRSVRNRTLPRLAADGEAWVRQGLGLADERAGEQPEALWRAGVEARGRAAGLGWKCAVDAMLVTRGLGADLVDLLGTDRQGELTADDVRRTCSFATPWGRLEWESRFGLRASIGGSFHVATGGVSQHLGLPAVEGRGEIGLRRRLFKNDLLVDLALVGNGRSAVETPYGRVAALGSVDGQALARVRSVDIFFVLANLTDTVAPSMAYDGGFVPLPARNYRAGLRWVFFD
jgi:hypothetical protein